MCKNFLKEIWANSLLCSLLATNNNVLFTRLVVIVILYFIIGSVIMKCHYQATGSDIIPNKTFWITLPFLVKVNVTAANSES